MLQGLGGHLLRSRTLVPSLSTLHLSFMRSLRTCTRAFFLLHVIESCERHYAGLVENASWRSCGRDYFAIAVSLSLDIAHNSRFYENSKRVNLLNTRKVRSSNSCARVQTFVELIANRRSFPRNSRKTLICISTAKRWRSKREGEGVSAEL